MRQTCMHWPWQALALVYTAQREKQSVRYSEDGKMSTHVQRTYLYEPPPHGGFQLGVLPCRQTRVVYLRAISGQVIGQADRGSDVVKSPSERNTPSRLRQGRRHVCQTRHAATLATGYVHTRVLLYTHTHTHTSHCCSGLGRMPGPPPVRQYASVVLPGAVGRSATRLVPYSADVGSHKYKYRGWEAEPCCVHIDTHTHAYTRIHTHRHIQR